MKSTPLLIDTNLLVLYIVGTASKSYIERHKRLTEFVPEDYDALLNIIGNATSILVTPNTLTEASNLLRHIAEPARGEILNILKKVVAASREMVISSQRACSHPEFLRLGLTDAALIEATVDDITLLTTDLDLFIATQSLGSLSLNFNHVRDQYLGV